MKTFIRLRGTKYKVSFKTRFRKRKDIKRGFRLLGDCSHPQVKNPEIRVLKGLGEKENAEILIHEMLHGCFPDLDEESITESAISIQRALYKLGYRLIKK